jgi:hypothetical protein
METRCLHITEFAKTASAPWQTLRQTPPHRDDRDENCREPTGETLFGGGVMQAKAGRGEGDDGEVQVERSITRWRGPIPGSCRGHDLGRQVSQADVTGHHFST